jgi:hypothetical protein
MQEVANWVERYRQFWEERLDRLEVLLQERQPRRKRGPSWLRPILLPNRASKRLS